MSLNPNLAGIDLASSGGFPEDLAVETWPSRLVLRMKTSFAGRRAMVSLTVGVNLATSLCEPALSGNTPAAGSLSLNAQCSLFATTRTLIDAHFGRRRGV